jgi:MFS family permease
VSWVKVAAAMAAAGGLTMGFGRLTFAFVLEDMRRDFISSYTVAGIIGAANLLGYLVGVFLTNHWLRRHSPSTLAVRGMAASLVGMVGVPLLADEVSAFLFMALLGFTGGIVWISCVPIVSRAAPPRHRGVAYGIMVSGIGTSIALTGLIVRWSTHTFGAGAWREVWYAEAGLGLVLLVVVARVLARDPVPAPEAPPEEAPSRAGVGTPPGLGGAVACYFLYGVVHSLYSNFLVAGVQQGDHLSAAQAASVFSLLGLTNIVGGIVLGRSSDVVGRRPVLIAAMATMTACAAVIPTHATVLVVASAAVYGLLMSGLPSVITATLNDRFSGAELSAAYTAITLGAGAGQLIGPPVGGALADGTGGFTSTFVLAAVAAAVGIVAAARIRTRS